MINFVTFNKEETISQEATSPKQVKEENSSIYRS